MTEQVTKEARAGFRQHLPDLNTPRFTTAKQQDPYEYAEAFRAKQNPPWLFNLTQAWEQLLKEPYKGVTADGNIIPDLFQTRDEGVPILSIVSAVDTLSTHLNSEQKKKLHYPLSAQEWRAWSNPEVLLRPFGLRLEEISSEAADAVLDVVRATFSPAGYEKALAAMRINHFLGEICQVPRIMNKYSYNFLIFGTPSSTEAWGWSLYGHHLCLNVFLKGTQIVISPTFTGAEPNVIDDGDWAGTSILHREGDIGLKLMQTLTPELRDKAQIYKLMKDPGMKQTGDLITDRWNKDDQRHVCGAFRDNRVVPYEGIKADALTDEQKQLMLEIVEEFLLFLPDSARKTRLEDVKGHFDETYFSWIGGYGDEDPFYYRIQSPVIVVEFDHHSGVFLSNTEPAKFHTHTIVRTPNGGDYGNALRKPEEKL